MLNDRRLDTAPTAALLWAVVAAAALVGGGNAGCSSLSPPFSEMKASQMTIYRLQNFEPPVAAQAPGPSAGLQLPPQIQQWIAAGASLLPPGLLPPGLAPGSAPPAPVADAQRFHGFRILEWQPINDANAKGDVIDLFGHSSNFQTAPPSCMYAEFGFAMAQPNAPTPADVLVSLSCEQVQAFNFQWPYSQTGVTPSASQKVGKIVQEVFQGR